MTLLGRLLDFVRTYDGETIDGEAGERFRTLDFYGSPLDRIAFCAPYPSLPLDVLSLHVPRPGGEPEDTDDLVALEPARYPPHCLREGLDDFDLVSHWPLPELAGHPTRLTVFLEVMRIIAGPLTDTDVDRRPEGLLSPGKLPAGYFYQAILGHSGRPLALLEGDVPDPSGRQMTLFRRTVLSVYTHLLLRCLAVQRPEILASALAVEDNNKRRDLFLAAVGADADARWARAIVLAGAFVRRSIFWHLFFAVGDARIDMAVLQHDPQTRGRIGLAKDLSSDPMLLPPALASLVFVCVNRAGKDSQLFPDNYGHLHAYIDDAQRLARFDALLDADQWQPFDFSADKAKGDMRPTTLFGAWASLCVVLEALIDGRLAVTNSTPSGETPFMTPSHDEDAQRRTTAELALGERGVTSDCQSLVTTSRRSASSLAPSGQRYAPADTTTLFTAVSLLDIGDGYSARIVCQVQRDVDGRVPRGTIWLPIENDLVATELELEVRVHRYVHGEDGSQAQLESIEINVTDECIHENGTFFMIEPIFWDDPALPPGYARGEFEAVARLGLVGSFEQPERLVCVIACVSDRDLR